MFLLYLLEIKILSNLWYYFFAMAVCAFNSSPNGEYLNLFNVAAFSSKSFSAETSLAVKKIFTNIYWW